ncbi:hypothetical protein HOLleu_03656 [Holothuria leucospilota]|uniref:Uncharacterized protein n=1 Tax=Holothuria leucospilota TaxID=206669 RepID=A0A9Q1HLX9_HOLLE|nr:hypothetical protein HOLleu_03656 [Holothuria leucospilota]
MDWSIVVVSIRQEDDTMDDKQAQILHADDTIVKQASIRYKDDSIDDKQAPIRPADDAIDRQASILHPDNTIDHKQAGKTLPDKTKMTNYDG